MKTLTISKSIFAALLMLFTLSTTTFAQSKLQQANDLKAAYKFMEAIEMYKEAFKENPPDIQQARDLAKCYILINDTRSAEEWLAKINSFKDVMPLDVFQYANILKSNGKYKEAIVQYNTFAKRSPMFKDKIAYQIASCNKAIEWMNDSTYINIKNEEAFNSDNSDFGLSYFPDGWILTSDRKQDGKNYNQNELYGWTGNPYLQLYSVSDKKDDGATLKHISILNSQYHNGPGIYDANSKTYYFTRTKMVTIRKPVNSDPTDWTNLFSGTDYTNRLEIFYSRYSGGKWSEPAPFPYNDPEKYSIGHPTLSSNGKIMYFASDMGGYGSSDIYYCELQADGKWSSPINAGNMINTDGKEVFPFVDNEGTLYFSSDGHMGMGGLDIFSAKGSKEIWSKPENMSYPINSPKDDFSMLFDSKTKSGYFSSNRENGKGEDDIYSFTQSPPKVLILAVTTKEKISNSEAIPLKDVRIKLQNTQNKTEKFYVSNVQGKVFTPVDCNTQYVISTQMEGYFNVVKPIETTCKTKKDTIFAELVLDKIIINKPIVIENIYYDFDKWNIRPDAAAELDKIVEMMNNNPQITIELSSHTDSRGSFQYNDVLSSRRAKSAVEYIISKGISSSRISAKGYGEKLLINKCSDKILCNETEHQLNRRTEFKVTSISNDKFSMIHTP